LWDRAQPLNPQAIQYLSSRSLDPVAAGAEKQLRWLPDWRGDEGAMLAAVTDESGALVAIQITYVTADGQKSAIAPARITIRGPHDWRTRGAFRLGSTESPELVLTEGVEDAMTALLAGAEQAHACLGVGALGRAQLPKDVTRVTIARDDDLPGSPACQALGRGVARILLQGKQAAVTPRAGLLAKGAKDLNDLFQIDVGLARRMLKELGEPKDCLDPAEKEALLDEVSRVSTDVYENHRKVVAEALGWRAGALDDECGKRRQARRKGGDDPVVRNIKTEPWPDPVLDLGAVLNESVKQTKRFVVAPDSHHDAKALWSAHTHLVYREELEVEYTPRLGIQSPKERCGKSTALKCVHLMSHNSRAAASLTASSVFRAIDAFKISIMIEEGDKVFKNAQPELYAVLNAGADKMLARVPRSEKTDDGKFAPREFSCFAPVAFTSIKKVERTLQDRSIVLQMKRARKGERPEKLTIRTRGGLIDVGRKFLRWAIDLKELPTPDLPEDLFNRIEDRWFVLFQIAHLAGGDWPERCRKAAMADFAREEADAADGRRDLLADVWEVFRAKQRPMLFTKDILNALLNSSESPWETAHRGKPVDEYYLRAHLRDFLPRDAEKIAPRKWQEGNVEARGFHQRHLEDAFARYLGKGLPCASGQQKRATEARDTPAHAPSPISIKRAKTSVGPSTNAKSDIETRPYVSTGDADGSITPSVDYDVESVSTPPLSRSTDDASASTDQSERPSASSADYNMQQDQPITGESTDTTDKIEVYMAGGRGIGDAFPPPVDHPSDNANNNRFPAGGFVMPRPAQSRSRRRRETP
jgi:putative DNA primase/helicase